MLRIGPVDIPVAIIWIALAALIIGYLVYFAFRLFQPARGQHSGAFDDYEFSELRDPVIPEGTPLMQASYQPRWHAAPLPEVPEYGWRDEYLDRFDALLLSTRSTFSAIREFAAAGFDSIGESNT